MKLKQSIYLMIFICSFVPVCVLVFFSVRDTKNRLTEITYKNVETIGKSQVMSIENFCEGRRESLGTIAEQRVVQDAVLESLEGKFYKDGNVELDKVLANRKRHNSFVISLSVVNRDFLVVGSSDRYTAGEVSELKVIKEKYKTGDFILGDTYTRETDDGMLRLIPVYLGIYHEGELVGYLAEEIDCAYFDRLRLNTDFLADGTLYLIDGRGDLITAGNREGGNREEMISSAEDRKSYRDAWNSIDHTKEKEGHLFYEYQGDEYLTYFSEITYTDWGIRITENLTAQVNTNRTFGYVLLFEAFFFVSVILIMQFIITRRLIAPFDKIVKVLKRVQEKQDYSLRTGVKAKDEVGTIARGVDELLEYIEKEDLEDKKRKRELQKLAESDPLTGIKNKRTMEHKMINLVEQAVEEKQQVVICFIDIDHFRDYNAKYGHQNGDEAIRFVADTISSSFQGICGRYGGDEFVVCYVGKLSKDEIERRLDVFKARLNEGFYNDVVDARMLVTCSVGVAIGQGEKLSFVEMIKKADDAMFEAKEAGRNGYRIHYLQA